jgi:hypothetical protein
MPIAVAKSHASLIWLLSVVVIRHEPQGRRPYDRPQSIYLARASHSNQKKSGTFFSQLFGWTRKEVDAGKYGIYTLFQKDGQAVVVAAMIPWQQIPIV